MRLSKEIEEILLPHNYERLRIIGVVEKKNKRLVKHNCYNHKHYQHTIVLNNIWIDIDEELVPIPKNIEIKYKYPATSNFSSMVKGDNVEFYAKIIICKQIYIERPTKIIKISK